MNLLNRVMSYDKTKNENQEKCNCAECIRNAEISEKKEIAWDFKYTDNFLIKIENYRMRCREYEILNTMNLEYWYKDVKTKWFIFRALWIHGNKYDYHKTKYIKYKEKVEITCRVKGHNSFPQTPSDHLDGHGCKFCGIEFAHEKQKMTLKEFIEESNKVHGVGRYDYSKVNYINNRTEVIIICPNHDEPYEFPQKPTDHLSGKGCSLCCEKSKGEIKIRLFLTNHKIQFEREKRFKDCRDKYPLPFDFYISQYNICIEFDGIQHFNPSSFVYGNTSEKEKLENFEYIQRHDQIKNEYCKKNGIVLLRFNNLKTVEQELAEYFKNHGIVKELTLFDL